MNAKFSIFFSALVFQVAFAQSRLNIAEVLAQSDLVKNGGAKVVYCFSNADFRVDYNSTLSSSLAIIKHASPNAVQDNISEVCVDTSEVSESNREQLDNLKMNLSRADQVELAIIKPTLQFQNSSNLNPSNSEASQISLTLRAAAIGAASAYMIQKARPALDFLSDKGSQKQVSLSAGAAIGIISDSIQRLSGETNENLITKRNFGASLIGSMIQTRDPNVVGLAIVLAVSQIPAVQQSLNKLANSTPQQLSPVIPAIMVGSFVLLGHNRSGESWKFDKDKSLQGLTFGAAAAMVTASYKGNETAGFIVASAISLLDELCDAATKRCKGRFSLADLTANTIGAFLGAKIGGMYFSKDRDTLNLYYHKKW